MTESSQTVSATAARCVCTAIHLRKLLNGDHEMPKKVRGDLAAAADMLDAVWRQLDDDVIVYEDAGDARERDNLLNREPSATLSRKLRRELEVCGMLKLASVFFAGSYSLGILVGAADHVIDRFINYLCSAAFFVGGVTLIIISREVWPASVVTAIGMAAVAFVLFLAAGWLGRGRD